MPSDETSFVTITRVVASPGRGPDIVALLGEIVARDADEPGTLVQTVQVERGAPDVIWLYELWADSAAHEAHRRNGLDLRERLFPLVAEPLTVTTCEPLFGHGLDLAHLTDTTGTTGTA
jgi:quinol monooxygenase YgiN